MNQQESLESSLLESLRSGAVVTKNDLERAAQREGGKVGADFISSAETKKAVKVGVVSMLTIHDIDNAKRMMEEFGVTKEAMVFELAVSADLNTIIASEMHGDDMGRLENLKQIFGEDYLKYVPVIENIKTVIDRSIIGSEFDKIDQFEKLGLSNADVEGCFRNLFVNSYSIFGAFDQISSKYFDRLKLSEGFFKDEAVIGVAKQLAFFDLGGGNIDRFQKIKKDYKLDVSQTEFEKELAKFTKKLKKTGQRIDADEAELKRRSGEKTKVGGEIEFYEESGIEIQNRIERSKSALTELKKPSEIKTAVEMIGYSAEFMDEGYSEKVATKEGFVESNDTDGPRAAVFSAMKEGEYKLLHYPSGDVSQKPELQGYVHTILYKSAGGKNLEKTLSKNELGWTKFAAQSLVDFVSKESENNKREISKEFVVRKDMLVKQNGFIEVGATKLSGSRLAIFKNLKEGQLITLTYPDGEIAKDGTKKGYVHTVIYKDLYGRFHQKQLNDDKYKNGWTEFEANSLVKGIEDSQG